MNDLTTWLVDRIEFFPWVTDQTKKNFKNNLSSALGKVFWPDACEVLDILENLIIDMCLEEVTVSHISPKKLDEEISRLNSFTAGEW